MHEATTRPEPHGTPSSVARPLAQRVLAGVVASTLAVSGCGGAFDAPTDDPNAQAPEVPSSLTRLEPLNPAALKIEMSEDLASKPEDSESDESGLDAAEPSSGVVGKAVNCTHKWTARLSNMSYDQVLTLRSLWTEQTSQGTRYLNLTNSSEAAGPERQHVSHYYDDLRWVGRTLITKWSMGVRSISTANGTASFDISWTNQTRNSRDCTTLKRKLKEVDTGANPNHVHQDEMVAAGVSAATGLLVGVAAAGLINAYGPPPIQGLGAPIGGCLMGVTRVLVGASFEQTWPSHAQSALNIGGACAAGAGIFLAAKAGNSINAKRQALANAGAVAAATDDAVSVVVQQVAMVQNAIRADGGPSQLDVELGARNLANALEQGVADARRDAGLN